MVTGPCRYSMKASTMLGQSATQYKSEIKAVNEQEIWQAQCRPVSASGCDP